MSSSKRQSLIMTGICLILISLILFFFAFSQPKVTEKGVIDAQMSNTADSSSAISSSSESEYDHVDSDVSANAYAQAEAVTEKSETNADDQSREYDNSADPSSAENTSSYAQSTEAQQSSSSFSGKINLNTCTAEELTALDGIGEKKADAIIQYREYLGGYTSVEQVKDIKGIGDKIYEKISPYLTV